jgi:hypothetical protein
VAGDRRVPLLRRTGGAAAQRRRRRPRRPLRRDLVGELPDPVDVDRTLDTVDAEAMARGRELLPVLDGDRLVGVLPLPELADLHPTDRSVRTAGEVMATVDELPLVDLDAGVRELIAGVRRRPPGRPGRRGRPYPSRSSPSARSPARSTRCAGATARRGRRARRPPPADRERRVTETPRRRSWWRVAFYAASAALLGWASMAVPLPYVEYVPGTPAAIEPLLELEGVETTPLEGETALLTVLLRQQPTVPAMRAWLDDDRRLLEVQRVFPPGTDRQEFFRAERERFGRQFELAAAVGCRGRRLRDRARHRGGDPRRPRGRPRRRPAPAGDVVLAVDGSPIVAAEELQARARARTFGDTLDLLVRRDGEEVEVTVELGASRGRSSPRSASTCRPRSTGSSCPSTSGSPTAPASAARAPG